MFARAPNGADGVSALPDSAEPAAGAIAARRMRFLPGSRREHEVHRRGGRPSIALNPAKGRGCLAGVGPTWCRDPSAGRGGHAWSM